MAKPGLQMKGQRFFQTMLVAVLAFAGMAAGAQARLQVVVTTTQMRNGEKAGEPVPTVIGDWAAPEWTGPRAERDRPLAPPWPGLGR